ncbi:enoyl-CoA hydratase/isomerase family protein, partial [Klebsiella pneumoniae]|uniref:enoyl-CoA hydratase/isomerase family protein n=1 Tax=Klebsiella pneumoniae TaxID=573 RepID=UPI00351D3D35
AWAKDPNIVCVLLRGNGPKAFCAGGEVRSLALACLEQPVCAHVRPCPRPHHQHRYSAVLRL